MKNPGAKPKLEWKRVDSVGFGKGILEGTHHSGIVQTMKKEIERAKAEILEREEKRKKRTEEFREKDRQYSEKLRNGTPEERERERMYQDELKRTGGLVNDSMER